MKNLIQLTTKAKCDSCSISGFFCYTPNSADYKTCPCCTEGDFINYDYVTELYKQYFTKEDESKDNVLYDYSFCKNCRIIFDVGCTHTENGSTNNCYNGHFIGKWKYKDEVYVGMPQFDSIDEWFNEYKNIEILEWICINGVNTKHCTKGYYPKNEYPQYYNNCKL